MPKRDLPAVPIWFGAVTDDWTPYEKFNGVLGAAIRRKDLERLREALNIEFTCRSLNPGTVKLYARTMPKDSHQL